MMKKDDVRISLRLPREVWEKVKKEAQENERSLNAEIVNRLKKQKED